MNSLTNTIEALQKCAELEHEHTNLAQELNNFYSTIRLSNSTNENKEDWAVSIQTLRNQVLDFCEQLNRHTERTEMNLLPILNDPCYREKIFPSTHFSSLLMKQHYHSAQEYLKIFIDQTAYPKEHLNRSEVMQKIAFLREGLILLMEYLQMEKQFMLLQAEQLI